MHYEKLQIDDTSFKTHEQLQIFEQPNSRLFYKTTFITHSGKYPQKIPKSIQQEHRLRKLNTLTVNETSRK